MLMLQLRIRKKILGRILKLMRSYMIFRCQIAQHVMKILILALGCTNTEANFRHGSPFVDDTRYILHCDTIYCNSSVIFDVLNLVHIVNKQCIELSNIASRQIRTVFQGSLSRQLDVVKQVASMIGRREGLITTDLGLTIKAFIEFGATFLMNALYFASKEHSSFIGYSVRFSCFATQVRKIFIKNSL